MGDNNLPQNWIVDSPSDEHKMMLYAERAGGLQPVLSEDEEKMVRAYRRYGERPRPRGPFSWYPLPQE